MKTSMAVRLSKMLRERGFQHKVLNEAGETTILWWEHDMGEQHRITGKSLLCDQDWMNREVIK